MGRRNRSRVRGIDQLLANASQLGKGLGKPTGLSLVELLFQLILEVRKIQTGPVAEQRLASDPMLRESPGLRVGTVTTPYGPAVYMVQNARHSSEHAVMPNPSIEGRPYWPFGRPHVQTLRTRSLINCI